MGNLRIDSKMDITIIILYMQEIRLAFRSQEGNGMLQKGYMSACQRRLIVKKTTLQYLMNGCTVDIIKTILYLILNNNI